MRVVCKMRGSVRGGAEGGVWGSEKVKEREVREGCEQGQRDRVGKGEGSRLTVHVTVQRHGACKKKQPNLY